MSDRTQTTAGPGWGSICNECLGCKIEFPGIRRCQCDRTPVVAHETASSDTQADLSRNGEPQTTDIVEGKFSVFQNGIKVAFGRGPYDRAKAEGMHYAAMFAQDGPVKLTVRRLPQRKENARG